MTVNERVIRLYLKSKELFNEFEKIPRDFGTGDLLYSSEIHTLVEIGMNNGINLTELANILGISKSGTSKFVAKLVDKELIVKEKAINNNKEVVFSLSDKGEKARKGHAIFKEKTLGPIIKMIDDLDDTNKEVIADFLSDLVDNIKNIETKC